MKYSAFFKNKPMLSAGIRMEMAVQLMRQLNPTVDILPVLGLSSSGVFGKGFGLVRLIKPRFLCGFSSLPCRDIYQQR
jgi:hypothetical protein